MKPAFLFLVVVVGCGRPGPSPASDEMTRVPGARVRMGRKMAPPVAGYTPPPPPVDPKVSNPASPPPPGARGDFHPAPELLEPRDVRVSAFWIDTTEVTQGQYARFLEETGYRPPFVDEAWAMKDWNWSSAQPRRGRVRHPVVLVNWYDAFEYCAWAGKRLPTEAEWQLAALGPAEDERLFPWGDTYDGAFLNHGTMEPPNYDRSDGYRETSPVGAFPAGRSRYGLLDVFGNAWEWTADFRVASWEDILGERRSTHDGEMVLEPRTSSLGLYAAVRGGSYFFDFRPNPTGERNAFPAELRRKSSGFRCARSEE